MYQCHTKFDYNTKEHIKEHHSNWPGISDHLYRTSIVGGSRSDQSRTIEQAKFTYSSLLFWKSNNIIEDQGTKQFEALKTLKPEENQELQSIAGLFPKNMRNNEIKMK